MQNGWLSHAKKKSSAGINVGMFCSLFFLLFSAVLEAKKLLNQTWVIKQNTFNISFLVTMYASASNSSAICSVLWLLMEMLWKVIRHLFLASGLLSPVGKINTRLEEIKVNCIFAVSWLVILMVMITYIIPGMFKVLHPHHLRTSLQKPCKVSWHITNCPILCTLKCKIHHLQTSNYYGRMLKGGSDGLQFPVASTQTRKLTSSLGGIVWPLTQNQRGKRGHSCIKIVYVDFYA